MSLPSMPMPMPCHETVEAARPNCRPRLEKEGGGIYISFPSKTNKQATNLHLPSPHSLSFSFCVVWLDSCVGLDLFSSSSRPNSYSEVDQALPMAEANNNQTCTAHTEPHSKIAVTLSCEDRVERNRKERETIGILTCSAPNGSRL